MQSEPQNEPPSDWTAKYWQWVYSKPKEENPLKTGEVNIDEFLCLPCTGGGEDCGRVLDLRGEDSRKPILVPVFASEYSDAEILNATDEQLREKAREMSAPVDMEISLDGQALLPYYIESEPFYITVPSNHSLENTDAPAGKYKAVSCGYWHLLDPLPIGKHVVIFGGSAANGFYTKVKYQININS
jgi:hypothetical protein